jgi:hypothetical protein
MLGEPNVKKKVPFSNLYLKNYLIAQVLFLVRARKDSCLLIHSINISTEELNMF